MKKNILSLAALLIASATMFTACSSSDDSIISENQQPAQTTGKYTMTIQASKGDGASTRALTLDGNTLNATWDENEAVLVYQGGSQIGTLYSAASATSTTTLTGELTSAPAADQDLTLYFHTDADPDATTTYANQDGTLAKIASTYDLCAPAIIAKGNFNVSGKTVSTTSSVSFGDNAQSIVKFTLKDKDSDALLNASEITASLTLMGTTMPVFTYAIPDATYTKNGDGVVYFAIRNLTGTYALAKSSLSLTITATVGTATYTYTKPAPWPFGDGKYYEITVNMTKQAAGPTYPVALSAVTADYVGSVVTTDGNVYATVANATAAGKTAAAMIAYVDGTGTSLAIALADEGSMNWATAKSTCEGKTAITGGTWKLPSQDEWKQMFSANGGSEGSYAGLNTAITAAGGTALQGDYNSYWTSSESNYVGYAYCTTHSEGNVIWGDRNVNHSIYVRACLAFTVESSAGPTAYTLAESTVGMVVGTDGKAYAAADKDNLPSGVTAAAMVAYKSETTGYSLAIALADEGSMDWATAKSTCEGKAAIDGYSWKLPSQEEWVKMFGANGDNQFSCSGLNSAITTAGGTALQEYEVYWSSSEVNSDNAFDVDLYGGGADWRVDPKNTDRPVRACLAF